MLKNQLKLAFRNIVRNGTYSVINILGLTLGLASALLLVVYVSHELSYDKFHQDSDRIYRVSETVPLGDGLKYIASTSMAVSINLRVDYPELEAVTFLSRPHQSDVSYNGLRLYEDRIHAVDESFFSVFDFEFLIGSEETSLKDVNTIAITASTAKKYFGDEDPIGKILRINQIWRGRDMPFTVTAVLKDMPANSHFKMDMLIGMNSLRSVMSEGIESSWGWDSGYTYFKTPENFDIAAMEASFPAFINKNMGYEVEWLTYFTRKMTEIHLQSDLNSELESNGSLDDIYIFSIVAFAIIFIAAINYINMATAIASRRSQEIGVLKTLGAVRGQLIRQFLTEAFVMTFIATLLAGFLAEMITPAFNNISGSELNIGFFEQPKRLLFFVISSLSIGLISGAYPAFYLSSFSAIKGLKGQTSGRKPILNFRKGMLIFQFGISIFLIVTSLMVYNQWAFMRDKDYGIDTESTIIFSLQNGENQERFDVLKSKMESNPDILAISTSHRRIGRNINQQNAIRIFESDSTFEEMSLSVLYVEPDFLPEMGVKLKAGRFFMKDNQVDLNNSVMLNQEAVDLLKNKDVIGRNYTINNGNGTIIGVTDNFHFESLYNKIKATVFIPTENANRFVTMSVNSNKFSETIAFMNTAWNDFDPDRGFRYDIVGEDIRNLYGSERRFFNLFTIATALAIFIASLGILGLVSFSAYQKTKEIGIRKVLGADTAGITFLLTKEFIILIIVANLLAWPAAYFFSDNWLSNYSYRIPVQIWPFVLATIIALFIAVFTAATQTIRAAQKNPVDSLRCE
jgi:putative ABC transport system permease protein